MYPNLYNVQQPPKAVVNFTCASSNLYTVQCTSLVNSFLKGQCLKMFDPFQFGKKNSIQVPYEQEKKS